jgi:two-component sensor histidine kinase
MTSIHSNSYTIFDNLIEGLQIIDEDWCYVYLNNAVVQQSKLPQKELIGRSMSEIYPGIEKTEMFETLEKCKKEGVPISTVNKFVFPDKSSAWFKLSVEPYEQGLLILSYDISEEVSMQMQLEISNEKLKSQNKLLNAALNKLKKKITENQAVKQELHHRIKNNIQLIISLLTIQTSKSTSLEIEHQMSELKTSIHSMALVHHSLLQVRNYTVVKLKKYLNSLCDYLEINAQCNNIFILRKFAPISMGIDEAVSFGLLVNELILSTIKFIISNKETANLTLTLSKVEQHIYFKISHAGKGFPNESEFKNNPNYNQELIDTLTEQLDGEIQLKREPIPSLSLSFKELKVRQLKLI